MDQNQKLLSQLKELEHLTGIQLQINAATPEESEMTFKQLQRLCNAYREKYDKEFFLKTLATSPMPIQQLEREATYYHINPSETRVSLLLETKKNITQSIITILKHVITRNGTLFIPVADNRLLILITIAEKNYTTEYLKTLSYSIVETLNMETFTDSWIVCGPLLHHLSELTEVFKKLSSAMSIGHIFQAEHRVYFYNHFGLEHLIHELPADVCNNFLNTVFINGVPALAPELISVINCFFENTLNIAETARKLHIHRNTLIYRLDQIKQLTNLNLRDFEDAVIFKIALIIMKRSLTNE